MYDPLCGADVERLLAGVREIVGCPVVGGAASQPWGPMVRTYQYISDRVTSGSAVAIGLSGPFDVDIGAKLLERRDPFLE